MNYSAPKSSSWLTMPKLTPTFCVVAAVSFAVGVKLADLNYEAPQTDTTPLNQLLAQDTAPTALHNDTIAQMIAQSEFGRRFVAPNEEDYSAISRINFADGGHCSGQPVYFEGYTTRPGVLVSTAAHCAMGRNAEDISFSKTYTNAAGQVVTYTTTIEPEVWVNHSYESNHEPGEKLTVRQDDNALIFFPGEALPNEITPIEQYVFSWHMGNYNAYKIGQAELRSAGYAADLSGALSADEDCDSDTFTEGSEIRSTCIANKGASGSALLASDIHNPNYSLAVLSGVTTDGETANISDDSFRSIYAPFYHNQLQGVSFLHKTPVCATLTGDYVNLRRYANIGSGIEVENLRFNEAAVYHVTSMLDRERLEVGDATMWIEVNQTPDGDSGYIRGDLLRQVPCPQ